MIERLREFLRKKIKSENEPKNDEVKPQKYNPSIQLGEDEKALIPDKWAQDVILEAWNTGKQVSRSRPLNPDNS